MSKARRHNSSLRQQEKPSSSARAPVTTTTTHTMGRNRTQSCEDGESPGYETADSPNSRISSESSLSSIGSSPSRSSATSATRRAAQALSGDLKRIKKSDFQKNPRMTIGEMKEE